jgi:hypothetical protein
MGAAEHMAALFASLAGLPAQLAELDSRLRAIDEKVEEVRRREDALLPLAKILGVSNKAAHMRMVRDPELRKLGVHVGRRVLFKRAVVESYYAQQRSDAS